MEQSRTKNSIKNLVVNMASQLIVVVVSFIARTFFIKYLGEELLGVNGLFTNILSVLSVAELGFGNAIVYSMYKPLKEHDTKKVTQLFNFYKKAYLVIAIIILALGLGLIPFLHFLVNTDAPVHNLILFYILFVLNTVASYILAYKTSIIIADQKNYITKTISTITVVIQFVLQTIILVLTRNFAYYLVAQIFCTLINNIVCSIASNRIYPYSTAKGIAPLSASEQKGIFRNVGSIFLHKISGIILNNTDNILISVLVGTVWVGKYSNYYMVTGAFGNIMYIIFSSATSSIGNLMVEKDSKKQLRIFEQMMFFSFFVAGLLTTGLSVLFNDFINIWVGPEFVLDTAVVAIIIANFYIVGILTPTWIYRDASGLFNDTRVSSVIMAIMNLILSILLGLHFGLFGILVATAISRICISSWYQPMLLYRKKFNVGFGVFLKKQIKYLACLIVSCGLSMLVCSIISMESSIAEFIVKGIISVAIFTLVCLIFNFGSSEYIDVKNKFILPVLIKLHIVRIDK